MRNEGLLSSVSKVVVAYRCVDLMHDILTTASLSAVQSRIDEVADLAGIDDIARLSVDDTLTALPWVFRRRLVLALQSLKAFSPDPGIRDAAEFFLLKAAKIWAAMPFEGHLDEKPPRTTVFIDREAAHRAAARARKP